MTEIPDPKVGDVLLYRDGKSLLSKLIRILTTSDYNHAGIYLGNGRVAEALKQGFTIKYYGNLKPYLVNGVDLYRHREKIDYLAIKHAILINVGKPYGFADLVKIAIHILTKKKIFKKQSKRLICSEAIAVVYRVAEKDLFPDLVDLDLVTPSDLANNKNLCKMW